MPADQWTPERIAAVQRDWGGKQPPPPNLAKYVHTVQGSQVSTGRMLCPACGVVLYARALHNHRLENLVKGGFAKNEHCLLLYGYLAQPKVEVKTETITHINTTFNPV